jgi:hypothetical protein
MRSRLVQTTRRMVGSVVVVRDEAIHLNSLFSAIGADALPEGFDLSDMFDNWGLGCPACGWRLEHPTRRPHRAMSRLHHDNTSGRSGCRKANAGSGPLRAAGQSRGTSEGLLKADVRAEFPRSILRTKLTVGSEQKVRTAISARHRMGAANIRLPPQCD